MEFPRGCKKEAGSFFGPPPSAKGAQGNTPATPSGEFGDIILIKGNGYYITEF